VTRDIGNRDLTLAAAGLLRTADVKPDAYDSFTPNFRNRMISENLIARGVFASGLDHVTSRRNAAGPVRVRGCLVPIILTCPTVNIAVGIKDGYEPWLIVDITRISRFRYPNVEYGCHCDSPSLRINAAPADRIRIVVHVVAVFGRPTDTAEIVYLLDSDTGANILQSRPGNDNFVSEFD